jgi:uncharacterized membrane protein
MTTPGVVLAVFMRFLHISSVVALIGGFIYARLAVWPALASFGAAESPALIEAMAARFRGMLYTLLGTTLISGLYNYLTKSAYPPHYHMVIGIKFLFVLHIFAVSILYAMPQADPAKRKRWLSGMAISGLIVIAISADLRWLSLNYIAH